jgi:hypothetical protein
MSPSPAARTSPLVCPDGGFWGSISGMADEKEEREKKNDPCCPRAQAPEAMDGVCINGERFVLGCGWSCSPRQGASCNLVIWQSGRWVRSQACLAAQSVWWPVAESPNLIYLHACVLWVKEALALLHLE